MGGNSDERVTDPCRPGEAGSGRSVYAPAPAFPGVGPYALCWGTALAAGFVATFASQCCLLVFFALVVDTPPLDLLLELGWPRTALYFLVGVVLALFYAGALLALRRQSNWRLGAILGGVVWLASLLRIPLLLSIPSLLTAAERLSSRVAASSVDLFWVAAAVDLGVFLLYGVGVGAIYRHLVRVTGL